VNVTDGKSGFVEVLSVDSDEESKERDREIQEHQEKAEERKNKIEQFKKTANGDEEETQRTK